MIYSMYHGSSKKEIFEVEIQKAKKGCYEFGHGFYTTTSRGTAEKYGRCILEVSINNPNFLTINDRISIDEARTILDELKKAPGKASVIKSINKLKDNNDTIPLIFLLNSLVNNESLSGINGQKFANILKDKGFDAYIDKKAGEDWMIIFNPAVISRNLKSTNSLDDKPRISEQVAFFEKESLNSDLNIVNKQNLKI